MIKHYITPALFFLLFTAAVTSAQTPNGVATPTVWFKANTATAGKITYNGSNQVSSWISEASPSSTNTTYAVTQTVGNVKDPVYNAGSTTAGNFNYNPFLQFTSANLTLLQNPANTDLAGSAGSIFVVANNNGYTGSQNPSAVTFTTSAGADALQRYQVKPFKVYTGVASTNLTSNVALTIPGTDLQASAAITTSAGSYTTLTGRRSAVAGTLTSFTNGSNLPGISTGLYVGGNSGSATEYSDQGIAEVILYNSTLTAANINKVESYLAIKYGITLGSGTAVSYVSSGGTTVWTGNATYQYEMIGVGLDNGSGLSQLKSHSINTSNGDGTGQSGTGNVELDASSAISTTGSFLLMGHSNTAVATTQTTDLPGGTASRLTRIWSATETGTVGNVTVSFDITGLAALNATFMQLLLGATTTFASATTYSPTSISGNIVSFSVPFASGNQFFTFAMAGVAPGGVSNGLTLWLKADKFTSTTMQGAAVTLWEDNVASYDFGVSATVSRRPTYTNQSADNYNYNPSIKFLSANTQYMESSVQYASNTFVNAPPVSGNFVGTIFGAASVAASGNTGNIINQWQNSATPINDYNFYMGYFSNTLEGGISKATSMAGLPSLINSANIMEVDRTSGTVPYSPFGRMNGKKATGGSVTTTLRQSPNWVNIAVNDPAVSGGFLNGNIGELFTYNIQVSNANIAKIESYLAIKYGITMDSSGIATDLASQAYYVSASGTNLYYGGGSGSAYWNRIIGIGRDDLDSLYQRQSHELDDSVRLYAGTGSIAASNMANGNNLTNNTFLMMGSNTGKLCANAATAAEMPPALLSPFVGSRVDREWKVISTGFTGDYNVDVVLSCNINNDDQLVLLVDDDGNFTNAQIISPGTMGMTYNRTTKTVSITGLNNQLLNNGTAVTNLTKYITIATTSFQVLPVTLLSFTAVADKGMVQLNWSTATETNSSHFEVQHSADGISWKAIAMVTAKGYSNAVTHYQQVDNNPNNGNNYYRLKEVDRDGKYSYSNIKMAVINYMAAKYSLYPNPASSMAVIKWAGGAQNKPQQILLYQSNGAQVAVAVNITETNATLNIAALPKGVYIVSLISQGQLLHKKLVKE